MTHMDRWIDTRMVPAILACWHLPDGNVVQHKKKKSHLFTSNQNAALSVAKTQSSSGTSEGSQLQSIQQWKSRVSRDCVVFSHLLLLDFNCKAMPSLLAVPRQCRQVLHGELHVCWSHQSVQQENEACVCHRRRQKRTAQSLAKSSGKIGWSRVSAQNLSSGRSGFEIRNWLNGLV